MTDGVRLRGWQPKALEARLESSRTTPSRRCASIPRSRTPAAGVKGMCDDDRGSEAGRRRIGARTGQPGLVRGQRRGRGVGGANDAFGGRCVFENKECVLAERPDLGQSAVHPARVHVAVLEPGKPSGMITPSPARRTSSRSTGRACSRSRSRSARCAPGISSTARPAPAHLRRHRRSACVIFMTGARSRGRDDRLSALGARRWPGKRGVETETPEPGEAYAPFPRWRLGRPEAWAALPWA